MLLWFCYLYKAATHGDLDGWGGAGLRGVQEGYLSPGDLPDSGMEPASPASSALAGRFFTTEPPGKPNS